MASSRRCSSWSTSATASCSATSPTRPTCSPPSARSRRSGAPSRSARRPRTGDRTGPRSARGAPTRPTARSSVARSCRCRAGAAARAGALRPYRAARSAARHPGQGVAEDPALALEDRHVVGHAQHEAPSCLTGLGAGVGVLDRDAVLGRDAERRGGGEVGLRVRLAELDPVAGHDGGEGVRRQVGEDRLDEPLPRHRHQGARDTARGEVRQQLSRSGAPRHGPADPFHDAVEELVDDLLGRAVDPHVHADVDARLEQRRCPRG